MGKPMTSARNRKRWAGNMASEELAAWLSEKVRRREMEGMWHG